LLLKNYKVKGTLLAEAEADQQVASTAQQSTSTGGKHKCLVCQKGYSTPDLKQHAVIHKEEEITSAVKASRAALMPPVPKRLKLKAKIAPVSSTKANHTKSGAGK